MYYPSPAMPYGYPPPSGYGPPPGMPMQAPPPPGFPPGYPPGPPRGFVMPPRPPNSMNMPNFNAPNMGNMSVPNMVPPNMGNMSMPNMGPPHMGNMNAPNMGGMNAPGYGSPYGQQYPSGPPGPPPDFTQASLRPRPPGARLRIPIIPSRGRYGNKRGHRKGTRWEAHTKYYKDVHAEEDEVAIFWSFFR